MKNSPSHPKYPVILVELHNGAVFLVLYNPTSFKIILMGISLQLKFTSHEVKPKDIHQSLCFESVGSEVHSTE